MDADSKSVLLSKTCITNLMLASLFEFHPGWKAWAAAHPDSIVLIYTVLNVVMRWFTTGPIHMFFKDKK